MEERQPAPLDTVELTAEPEATVEPEAPAAIAPDSERKLLIMVDLETMATEPDAAIMSIGAAAFDPLADRVIADSFYVAVNLDSSVAAGGRMDPKTVTWWMDPLRHDARERWLMDDKVDLYDALVGLNHWAATRPILGNGAAFDNVILTTACRAHGLEPFWKFWDGLCYRTIKRLAPEIELEQVGTYHHPLDDAISQALHMQRICKHLGIDLQ